MILKYIWRSFQPRLSFPRPFQLSLACFRVARSPSNSWASCLNNYMKLNRWVDLEIFASQEKNSFGRNTQLLSLHDQSNKVTVSGSADAPLYISWAQTLGLVAWYVVVFNGYLLSAEDNKSRHNVSYHHMPINEITWHTNINRIVFGFIRPTAPANDVRPGPWPRPMPSNRLWHERPWHGLTTQDLGLIHCGRCWHGYQLSQWHGHHCNHYTAYLMTPARRSRFVNRQQQLQAFVTLLLWRYVSWVFL